VSFTPHDLERLLRVGRPAPRPEFVHELERDLIPRRAGSDRVRVRARVALAGVGFAVALAAMVVVLGAAGLLPIHLGGGSHAQAERDCRTVMVERRERVPSFVRDANGDFVVRYDIQTVSRPVRRCR
jgi:hypothetical protein